MRAEKEDGIDGVSAGKEPPKNASLLGTALGPVGGKRDSKTNSVGCLSPAASVFFIFLKLEGWSICGISAVWAGNRWYIPSRSRLFQVVFHLGVFARKSRRTLPTLPACFENFFSLRPIHFTFIVLFFALFLSFSPLDRPVRGIPTETPQFPPFI